MTDSRIVLFGATGYTGRLTAAALVRRGIRPILAGRSPAALEHLSDELGALPTEVADVRDPASVRALVESGDVLLSTVGPFHQWGAPAVEAAVTVGAHYLDSTGEPAFIRRVFDEWSGPAKSAGVALLTAFGFDYVPGNLAGALALEKAGSSAVSVNIGYFTQGGTSVSAGTVASAAQAAVEQGFTFRRGEIRTESPGIALIRHELDERHTRSSISVSGTEHFELPALYPHLTDVRVGAGMAGAATPALWAFSRFADPILRIPGARDLARRAVNATVQGSGGGPSEEYNALARTVVTAHTYDDDGNELSRIILEGPSVYVFTAEVLAWGAQRLAAGAVTATGALGPVTAFGLDDLEAGCAAIGLRPSY